MPNLGTSYPRQITNYGSTRFPHVLAVQSQAATCGTLCFVTDAGDFWLYLNGFTPMFGGYTEIMTNPAGGIQLGPAVAQNPLVERGSDAVTVVGTRRVSSSAAIVSSDKPALGLMNGSGAYITYMFVIGATGQLRMGDEAQWRAGTGTLLATKAPSGKFELRRDGRSIIGGSDRPIAINAANIISGGRGGALALASGDQSMVVAFYTTDAATLTTSTYAAWRTWTYS